MLWLLADCTQRFNASGGARCASSTKQSIGLNALETVPLHVVMQAERSRRWMRQRAHWLRAAVALSTGAADLVAASRCDGFCVSLLLLLLLRDGRMRGCDDGEGRPLRYLSWYGGRVASML